MLQSNLVAITDPVEMEEAFEVVGRGDGPLDVTVPAYIDASSGFVIRRGIAERSETTKEAAPQSPRPDNAEEAEAEVTADDAQEEAS